MQIEKRPVINRQNLNKVFRDLRRMGYIARQNYQCCSSCAGYVLANLAKKKALEGATVRGCVFYHRQDAEDMAKTGEVNLRYGSLSTEMGRQPGSDGGSEVVI